MKIILDSGREYELNESEIGALGAIVAVYTGVISVLKGRDEGKTVTETVLINETMFHNETINVIKIVSRALGESIAKKKGITYDELEETVEADLRERFK